MAPLNQFSIFTEKVKKLEGIVSDMPKSIPLEKKDGRIPTVFKNIPVPEEKPSEHHEVFNRRMDALFGEDVRDAKTKRLLNVKRGPHGMHLVVRYLKQACEAGNLVWELALIKVDRIITELEEIVAACIASGEGRVLEPTPSKGPAPTTTSKKKKRSNKDDTAQDDNSDADPDYQLPKRPRIEEEAEPQATILDSDGEEIVEETELAQNLKEKHDNSKKKKTVSASVKEKAAAGNSKKKTTKVDPNVIDLDSGEESDGKGALREVEAAEASKGGRRGPANSSLQHYRGPEPVTVQGKKRWEYQCKHCGCYRRFERTVEGKDITIADENPLPKLNNLATHVSECRKRRDATAPDGPRIEERISLKRSADLMRDYLREGELNPAIIPTQTGFYRLFAAFILDESLPWTTGEAPSLSVLFRYLKVKFLLPSDTTVRSYLGRIFAELHGRVVREFTSVKSKIAYATDTWTTRQMVYTFACTIGSFINDDWELIERIIDFQPLKEEDHEGINGGLAFIKGARQCGGLDKISIGLTTDNASVNDVIVETAAKCLLQRYGVPSSEDMHIRCVAHVINLVVQAFLAGMDEAEDPEQLDWYETYHEKDPIHYDVNEDPEQKALDNEVDGDEDSDDENWEEFGSDDEDEEEIRRVRREVLRKEKELAAQELVEVETEQTDEIRTQSPLKRLRFITTKIVSSPQRRSQFRKIAHAKYAEDPNTKAYHQEKPPSIIWENLS